MEKSAIRKSLTKRKNIIKLAHNLKGTQKEKLRLVLKTVLSSTKVVVKIATEPKKLLLK